jgi:hypothetical protein
MRHDVIQITLLRKRKKIENNSCVLLGVWYIYPMTIKNITRNWVSDFTGLDWGRIENFEIDNSLLIVNVAKDWSFDFEHVLVDFLLDHSGTELVFDIPATISDDGKKDYENFMKTYLIS